MSKPAKKKGKSAVGKQNAKQNAGNAMAIEKIKDAKLNSVQKLQLVAQVVDSLGVDKSQLGMITNKIRSKMESLKNIK